MESSKAWRNTPWSMKTMEFDDILIQFCYAVKNQNTIDRGTKGCILPFLKWGNIKIAKNYRGITLRSRETSEMSTLRRILEGVHAKNCEETIFVDFTNASDSIHRGKIEQTLLAYDLPKETVAAIITLYTNIKVKVRSPDGGTDYHNIVTCVVQGDISSIPVYHMPRLCAKNVFWYNER